MWSGGKCVSRGGILTSQDKLIPSHTDSSLLGQTTVYWVLWVYDPRIVGVIVWLFCESKLQTQVDIQVYAMLFMN